METRRSTRSGRKREGGEHASAAGPADARGGRRRRNDVVIDAPAVVARDLFNMLPDELILRILSMVGDRCERFFPCRCYCCTSYVSRPPLPFSLILHAAYMLISLTRSTSANIQRCDTRTHALRHLHFLYPNTHCTHTHTHMHTHAHASSNGCAGGS